MKSINQSVSQSSQSVSQKNFFFYDFFQALMAEIDLNEDLVYYFGLFLIKRAEDGEATSKCIHRLFCLWV